jgi:hypothetical protein
MFCRVLLGSFRLGIGRSFSGGNFSFRTLSVSLVPLEASIGAANPGLTFDTSLQTSQSRKGHPRVAFASWAVAGADTATPCRSTGVPSARPLRQPAQWQ